jgi:hypothetical protein
MRFVRHVKAADWGLGVVASEDSGKLKVIFEFAGTKTLSAKVPFLAAVSDADVPAGHRLRDQSRWLEVERDALRATAIKQLPAKFDSFVAEFLRAYPEGFRSPRYEAEERAYKLRAGDYAREQLQATDIDALVEEGRYLEVIGRAKRVLGKTNLAFPNELMKFADIPESSHRLVAERLRDLIHLGDRTPEALEVLALALRPHEFAKWTICTLLPFLLDPSRWPFVKPTHPARRDGNGDRRRVHTAPQRADIPLGLRALRGGSARARHSRAAAAGLDRCADLPLDRLWNGTGDDGRARRRVTWGWCGSPSLVCDQR